VSRVSAAQLLDQAIESKICSKIDLLKIFDNFHGFSISLIGQQRLNLEQDKCLGLGVEAKAFITLSLQNHITSSQRRLFLNKLVSICRRSQSAKSLGVVCNHLLSNDKITDRHQIRKRVADLIDLF
jgi:hypothetical protein